MIQQDKRQVQMQRLDAEIRALRQNPIYVDYMKIAQCMNEGAEIADAISRKEKTFSMLASRREPFSHLQQQQPQQQYDDQQEYEEAPLPPQRQPKMATPQMKQELRQRPVPSPQRERELDKKVAMAESDFQATPLELGQEDDLELPDIDLEDDAK